ncbi:MAG: hypothetical protein HY901_31190 [Deltaproteobacteria bacterium]|nr:hypothetical protein [Deltaproteobacteria bacterium]
MLRRTALIAPLATALLALTAACDETNSPTRSDAGGLKEPGRSCNVDDECGGLRCDQVRKQCVCSSDEECAELHPAGDFIFCNNFTGRCVEQVAGCKAVYECRAGAYCDEQVRACRTRKGFCESCSGDRECGGDADDCLLDDHLQALFCGKFCTTDSDCAEGAACTDVAGKKQCWPKAGKNCKIFMGCIPDSKKSCHSTADCADVPDQVCDPGSGVCVGRLQICPFGQICDSRSKVCVDACGSDADCVAINSNWRCVNRACEPIGECAATPATSTKPADPSGDQGCSTDKVCSFNPGMTVGICVPFCRLDEECAQGSVCLPTSDGRRKCQPGCRVPADCPLDRTCVGASLATVGTCQGSTGTTCQADTVCPVCATCDLTTNACTRRSMRTEGFCRTCAADGDCGTGHCLQFKNGVRRCGVPCPPTGCPNGFTCNEICVGGVYEGYQCTGSTFAECIPVDQSCTNLAGSEKCAE